MPTVFLIIFIYVYLFNYSAPSFDMSVARNKKGGINFAYSTHRTLGVQNLTLGKPPPPPPPPPPPAAAPLPVGSMLFGDPPPVPPAPCDMLVGAPPPPPPGGGAVSTSSGIISFGASLPSAVSYDSFTFPSTSGGFLPGALPRGAQLQQQQQQQQVQSSRFGVLIQ